MNFFGGVPANTKQSITTRANAALDMFRTAVTELTESNNQAEVLRLNNQTAIDALTDDNNELEQLVEANNKAIDKISDIIG